MWQNANIKFDAIITSSAPALQWELFPTNQKNTKVHKRVSSELATPCALYNKTKSQWMTTVGNLSLLKARSTMFSFPTPCEQISLKPKRSFSNMNLQSEISKDIVFLVLSALLWGLRVCDFSRIQRHHALKATAIQYAFQKVMHVVLERRDSIGYWLH